jgi:putative heme-binding domain-containing protein
MLHKNVSAQGSTAPKREFVRKWTVRELINRAQLLGDPEAGRRLFGELRCFDCHRFRDEGGGAGPDLTTVVRRFTTRDLLEAILEPDKVISDQFAASLILTTDGKTITGRVVNLQSDTLIVQTNMLQPSRLERIAQEDIETVRPAKTSMMPTGLLDTCSDQEIADLVAFLEKDVRSSPPNIVLIVADDLGWADLGCFGNDLHETPHLDRLARQGVRFTDAYAASPVCTPTRAAILTGKYPARLHMTIWRENALIRGNRKLLEPVCLDSLPLEHQTLAEILKSAGYYTALVGKWHLGRAEAYPQAHGFHENVGGTLWGAPQSFWYPYNGDSLLVLPENRGASA